MNAVISGVITTLTPLDFEQTPRYSLTVTATDMGSPNPSSSMCARLLVTITYLHQLLPLCPPVCTPCFSLCLCPPVFFFVPVCPCVSLCLCVPVFLCACMPPPPPPRVSLYACVSLCFSCLCPPVFLFVPVCHRVSLCLCVPPVSLCACVSAYVFRQRRRLISSGRL